MNGIEGIVAGISMLIGIGGVAFWGTKGKKSFEFDAQGKEGAFEKLLSTYFDIAKFVLGLASGSIVLLVGSSAFRHDGHLPSSFASPLFLLILSIIYGILFMVLITTYYEAYRHQTASYTRSKYTINQAFGYGSVLCFLVGYFWLIVVVTR